jgi:hypothetical protein
MGLSCMKSILKPEIERIDPDFFSDFIQLNLHGESNLGNSVTPHRSSDRLIGVDVVSFKEKVFDPVRKHDEKSRRA